MKPVAIIVISVICSVVAVLGVLVVMDMYAVSESQKALAIELERQKVCDKLYDNTGSLQDIELWGICLNYGIIDSVNSDVELCGNSLSDYAELCRTEKKLEAIRLIEREITINQDFYNLALSQKSDLQTTKKMYDESIEKQQSEFDEMKIVLKNSSTNELLEIYKSCELPSYKYPSISCINMLNEITNIICEKTDASNPTCFTKTQADIIADKPIRTINSGIDYWNAVVYTCNVSQGMSLSTENPEMKQCICRYDFGNGIGPWHGICSNYP
jgi:hypothetical protein